MTEEHRFWSKVDKTGDCWTWLGGVDSKGYGRFTRKIAGRDRWVMHLAHRVALEYDGRPASPEEVARHSCDNPACVRPSHLSAGTQMQNVDDMRERHRQPAYWGTETHCANGHPKTPENRKPMSGRTTTRCRVCENARVRARTAERARARADREEKGSE